MSDKPRQAKRQDQERDRDQDQKLIRDIADLLNEANLAEIEIERDDFRVRITRTHPNSAPGALAPAPVMSIPAAPVDSAPANVVAPASGQTPVDDLASNPGTLTSPMVGTAYLSPEPGSAPFVAVGSNVVEGQTIIIVEAMKTMNQIPAHKSGTITRMIVEDSQPVEYGEPLVVIE